MRDLKRKRGGDSSRLPQIPPGREGKKRVLEGEIVIEKQDSCPLILIIAFSSFQELNLEETPSDQTFECRKNQDPVDPNEAGRTLIAGLPVFSYQNLSVRGGGVGRGVGVTLTDVREEIRAGVRLMGLDLKWEFTQPRRALPRLAFGWSMRPSRSISSQRLTSLKPVDRCKMVPF